jgi:ABC-2 type transport system permease protein
MNSHLLQIFAYELRRNFRRRGYLFTTFGVPLLGIVLLLVVQFLITRGIIGGLPNMERDPNMPPGVNLPFNPSDVQEETRAGYVDLAGVLANIPDNPDDLLIPYPNEEAARAALDADEIALYYRIEPDYLETGNVTSIMPRLDITHLDSSRISELLLRALSDDIDPDLVERVVDPSNIRQINIAVATDDSEGQIADEGASFILVYVFTIMLMLGLFVTNGYLMQSVIEEKETRLIEILVSTVRPSDLLAGKILAMGLLGLLQMMAWVGGMLLAIRLVDTANLTGVAINALVTIANIRIPVEILPLLAIYYLLAYLLFAALYGVVGALSNSMREGPQYAVVFTLPAVIPLYFISIFTTTPNATLPVILSLIPITAPVAMTQRLLIADVPTWQIVVSLALLVIAVVVVIWLAGRVFRVGTLLAGQAPKLRDLPKLIRG